MKTGIEVESDFKPVTIIVGMRAYVWIAGLIVVSRVFAQDLMLPVVQRNGENYVSGVRLERDAGIAIKTLPGQKQLAACRAERCGLVKDFIAEGDALLVRIDSLAQALDASLQFDATRQRVRFDFLTAGAPAVHSHADVGQLAPDLRLRSLDGSLVAISDFRGKRVLINSWASW
jgi:hypothetical protein